MKGNPNALSPEAACGQQFQTSPPHRILLVDEDPYINHLTAEVLIRNGYDVNAAEDGATAWEELNADHYHLLITNHSIPKVTGVQLLKKLRAARMTLPVIMARETLPKNPFARQPGLQPAATLLKPYSMEELLGTVKEMLRASGSPHLQIEVPPDGKATCQSMAGRADVLPPDRPTA